MSDHMLPDAPIHHLLSLKHNPNVAEMSLDELKAYVQQLRTLASSPQSMSAKLEQEGRAASPRKRKAKSGLDIARQSALDAL